jgi:regulator of PEP synthase PpsR (kinase-PPPase family)
LNITSTRRAAAAQYSRIVPVEYVHPLVRTQKRLDWVLIEIEEMPGIVLYTLLQENLVEEKCRALGLPCLSLLRLAQRRNMWWSRGEAKVRSVLVAEA